MKVAVVGCGLIGAGWTAYFLVHGLQVACCDPAEGAEERLRTAVAANFDLMDFAADRRDEALERLSFHRDLEPALSGAGWVQENAPENVAIKQAITRQIDAIAAPGVVIASSTSSIQPSDIQGGLKHPDRIVAGHPFIPVPLIGLVEVVGGAATSQASLDTAMEFYRSIGKTPILLHREIVGHVGNRLQAALMREAFFLLQEGVASAADIDLAITEGPGQRWPATGPFISHHFAGGAGGARAAFTHLGGAVRAMWADLGTPDLNADLEAKVEAGIADSLAAKPVEKWQESRLRILKAITATKAELDRAGT